MTSCWIVTEGMAGTENQCRGVAEALNIDAEIKRITLHQPWKSLSPYIPFEQSWSFSPTLTPPFPDLVLASGRKSIAAARYIKKASGGKTFTVQIQDPRISSKYFDLVAIPEHDPARGENVIVTTAAPNRISTDKLEKARIVFKKKLEALPQPRVAVMIGGQSQAYRMPASIMKDLCRQLRTLDEQGYGLMITASRRTGEENQRILHEQLRNTNAYIWNGSGENPYFGFLAWADYILVTADSVSMLSEATTTGKPTYMIPLEGGSKRLEKFHNLLKNKNIIRVFDGNLEKWTYTPLNDSGLIADAIRQHMNI